jgi:hypothetical protein
VGTIKGAAPTSGAAIGNGNKLAAEGKTPGGRDVSLAMAALTAGAGLLVMAALAFLGTAGLNALVVDGDAGTTATNIAGHALLYRLSVGGFFIVAVLDVVVAWALYLLLRPVNRGVALLAAWLRMVYAAIFAATLTNLIAAVRLATDSSLRQGLGRQQAEGQTLALVDAFRDGWNLALVIFGIHLLVLGYLIVRATYMPVLLGVLVMIAAVGYLIDGVASSLWMGYGVKLSAFTFIGEVALMAWLLWRGVRLRDPAAGDSVSSRPAPVPSIPMQSESR